MARKLRIGFAGACYHVINRGNYRRDLFAEPGAATSFERCLGEAASRFGWRVHAYVVMRNHFHIALETPEPNLGDGMRWLQVTWAVRFNRHHGESGHVFQGRYRAIHVEPGHALAQVAHYVHLNPARAGIVPIQHAATYRPSSLAWFQGGRRPSWLTADTILHQAGGLPDTRAGWRRYIAYLETLAGLAKDKDRTLAPQFESGWAIGSPEFLTRLRALLPDDAVMAKPLTLAGTDRIALRQARTLLWEEYLGRLATLGEIPLESLPELKSAQTKIVLAAAMKARTSVSNGWLAERLRMGTPASVSSLVASFRRRGRDQTDEFRKLLSRFAN